MANSGAHLLPRIDTSDVTEAQKFEYLACLRRSFIDGSADRKAYIVVDGHSGQYLFRVTNWALDNDILYYDSEKSEAISDEQWACLAYRPTKIGWDRIRNLK